MFGLQERWDDQVTLQYIFIISDAQGLSFFAFREKSDVIFTCILPIHLNMRTALLSPLSAAVSTTDHTHEKTIGALSALNATEKRPGSGYGRSLGALKKSSRNKPDSTSHSNSSSLSLSLRSSNSTSSRSLSQSPTERTSEEAETQYLQTPVVAPRPQSQTTQRSAARSIHPPSTGGTPSSGSTTLQHNHQHVSVSSLLVDQPAITVSVLPFSLLPCSRLFSLFVLLSS
jgi:hypothetical protein